MLRACYLCKHPSLLFQFKLFQLPWHSVCKIWHKHKNMKTKFTNFKKLALCLSLLIISAKTKAQWTDISPATYTNVSLFDVKFIDDNNGVAVGRDHVTKVGYIFKTTNSGTSWTTFTVPMSFFRAAAWADTYNGNVGGYNDAPASTHLIYNTNDAGTTYTLASNPISYLGIEHMQFLNSNIGFATGYGSMFGFSIGVYKTTDGGVTWAGQGGIGSNIGTGFYFTDANTGFITTGISATNGTIQKSTDGGISWSPVFTGNWLNDVCFVNSTTGYALHGLGTTSLVSTTNGGSTWSNVGTIGANTDVLLFLNQNEGYTAGNSGTIRKTLNGGLTWSVQTTPTSNNLNEISSTTGFVFACGDGGTVLKTVNTATGSSVGIKESANHITKVHCSPNPHQGTLKLQSADVDLNTASITAKNALGQLVKITTDKNSANSIVINLGNAPAGIYFIEINADNVHQVIKTVKE